MSKKNKKTETLDYQDMKKVFEDLGFRGFTVREYDKEMEWLFSCEKEDNAEIHMIDVVPSGLANGDNAGIALMEKHYYKKKTFQRLKEAWKEIILHFACYYPLESVFVTGTILPSDEDFYQKTPNEDGYCLEFPIEYISDLDRLIARVEKKTYGSLKFWFPSLHMVFLYTGDVYMMVNLKEVTEENKAAFELLGKIAQGRGLFLL